MTNKAIPDERVQEIVAAYKARKKAKGPAEFTSEGRYVGDNPIPQAFQGTDDFITEKGQATKDSIEKRLDDWMLEKNDNRIMQEWAKPAVATVAGEVADYTVPTGIEDIILGGLPGAHLGKKVGKKVIKETPEVLEKVAPTYFPLRMGPEWKKQSDDYVFMKGEAQDRNKVIPMKGNTRRTALKELSDLTEVRKGPNGKRQFKIYRGMGEAEYSALKAGDLKNSTRSSWTPDKGVASQFAAWNQRETGFGKVVSDWVDEDEILNYHPMTLSKKDRKTSKYVPLSGNTAYKNPLNQEKELTVSERSLSKDTQDLEGWEDLARKETEIQKERHFFSPKPKSKFKMPDNLDELDKKSLVILSGDLMNHQEHVRGLLTRHKKFPEEFGNDPRIVKKLELEDAKWSAMADRILQAQRKLYK